MRGACIACLSLAVVFAQPVIRSTTTLVQVRVVAEDSKGNRITNLRRQDFEISSDGKPQPLSFFTAASRATVSSNSDPNTATSHAPEGPGYALIVLDWLNSTFPDRVLVEDQLAKLLANFEPTSAPPSI